MTAATSVALGLPRVRSARPATLRDRPPVPGLIDSFGRTARDLRVSITEKCSLRCSYCMPVEGLPPIAPDRLLTASEIIRLVRIAVQYLEVREVRFTGGEPLLRRDLEQIIAGCAEAVPETPLSMTTNAVGLEHRAAALAKAGLGRVNVSLDTIDAEQFAALTRRNRLPSVLTGVKAARRAGLTPIKVNAVLMPETLSGAADLLRWCVAEACHLRFIEAMPLDADQQWTRERVVDAAQLLAALRQHFELTSIGRENPSAPAEEWQVNGGSATVGIIASVTRSFCRDCDRTRISAEGAVRSCLFNDSEHDLRTALRNGATDEELAQLWRAAMWSKPAGHQIDTAGSALPRHSMGAIGG
ncbi:GTP 3',8-cyclase MoaA [Mycobacterium aquaticum]|uniref:Cyclic pyranopterin phosphate synthase n=1 Tax=Mycobacterium aquaticum TaxID=1927124 RepID=A0A1X0BAI7_9MYCO|nr:GTP 3',8-cyclase MoaA [Mycobacterium aquaticum]ORA39229.1 cyclic pyranopterin phosphate synthase [Mycobacterium aquaticum]